MRFAFALAALAGLGSPPGFAQDVSKPAPVIAIVRETIKEGKTAAHERVEADYAAEFRKANFPGHYLALAALSGPGEVWFVQPMPSFATADQYDQAEEKEPLKSRLAAMDALDGELRASSRTLWAEYRPELSYRPEKFNRATERVILATIEHVKPGRSEDFFNGAKLLYDGYDRATLDRCILGYQVVAGAPTGTYLVFTIMDSLKALDGGPARSQAVRDAMGLQNYSSLMKIAADVLISGEEILLQVKPGMSYPSQQMIDGAPDFWKPKAAARPAGAATRAGKKAAQ